MYAIRSYYGGHLHLADVELVEGLGRQLGVLAQPTRLALELHGHYDVRPGDAIYMMSTVNSYNFV